MNGGNSRLPAFRWEELLTLADQVFALRSRVQSEGCAAALPVGDPRDRGFDRRGTGGSRGLLAWEWLNRSVTARTVYIRLSTPAFSARLWFTFC